MLVTSDKKAIRRILESEGRYACFIGAGASRESGVKLAQEICEEIRADLFKTEEFSETNKDREIQEWENSVLNWDDPGLQYVTCIKAGYGFPEERVDYFRKMLEGIHPSFCHYAVALLMTHRILRSTCLTTNFDKLIESAFTRLGILECQPIRTEDEVEYLKDVPEKRYVLKLHGDYDTYNVLNTLDETISLNEILQREVSKLLKESGLIVIGTAGYEESIYDLFKDLSQAAEKGEVLPRGLLWGIYMGPSRPKRLPKDIENLVLERIREKPSPVNPNIHRMIKRTNGLFQYFPIWGAGNFLFDLIQATEARALIGTAELYLDHEMRIRHVYTGAKLSEETIRKHIANLKSKQDSISDITRGTRRIPEEVFCAENENTRVQVSVLYGDITSRSFMSREEFQFCRRAVISPEDTFLSAGGGVAYKLLRKAGAQDILNELAKFSPIEQSSVAVTSAGKLPVHYIFHSAAVRIGDDPPYDVSSQSVQDTMTAALKKAKALEVDVLWVPLMGAGVADLQAKESLEGILKSISNWQKAGGESITILIVIFDESMLERHTVRQSLQHILGSQFTMR
jgi:O-acetyl-ADP-ribose deacetylase (regulator of RNase III)